MERYLRFLNKGKPQYGLLKGDEIHLLNGGCPEEFEKTGEYVSIREASILPPVSPGKIICIALNYMDTILEDGASFPQKPLLFLKPATAITLDGTDIVQTPMVKVLTIEAELTVVIGKKGKNISRDKAMDYIWGYVAANDVTAKDLQKEDGQWTRAKSFDTFLPLSNEIVAGINPSRLTVTSYINGEQVQKGVVTDMLFDIPALISYASEIMTLDPGDLILTGTPSGYGKIVHDKDEVVIDIPGVGKITNHIKAEKCN